MAQLPAEQRDQLDEQATRFLILIFFVFLSTGWKTIGELESNETIRRKHGTGVLGEPGLVPTTSTAYPKCCQNASGRVQGTFFNSCRLVFLSEILLAVFVLSFAGALIYVTITLVPTTSTAYPKCCQNASGRVQGTFFNSCRLVFLSEILLAIFVLSFAGALIYVTITLDGGRPSLGSSLVSDNVRCTGHRHVVDDETFLCPDFRQILLTHSTQSNDSFHGVLVGYFATATPSARFIDEDKFSGEHFRVCSPSDGYPRPIEWKRLYRAGWFSSLQTFYTNLWTMATEYKIMPSKLENLPTIDGQCCVNLTAMRNVPTTSTAYPKCCQNASGRAQGTFLKSCRLVFLSEILLTIFVLSFAGALIYVTITLGYNSQQPQQMDEVVQIVPSVINSSLDNGVDWRSLYQLIYKEDLEALAPQIDKLLSVRKQNRLKRDAETPCKQDQEHCKTVMESMWKIVNIVNSSMPYLQSLVTKGSDSKSQLIELVKCLQCKNDSITFIDESGPENVQNYYGDIHHHSDQGQMEQSVDAVTNLLNDKKPNPSYSINQEVTRPSTVSIFDVDDGEMAMKSLLGPSNAKIEVPEQVQEPKMVNATPMQSDKTKEDATTSRTGGIDNVEQTVDVTNASDFEDVMEIQNELVHPSVHPSDQGHAELNDARQEAGNVLKSRRLPYSQGLKEARIVFNDRLQPKGNQDFSPNIIPTAETMKSSQQLQLTPTMSWMPYQVCFYAPPNGGPGKSFTPGQTMYPATSPGNPYPITMPQQRMGPQNSGQAPNFVQVHAQSVQFMQPSNGNQRVGPTGPAMPNFPMFPGQMTPSAAARGADKSPYYCTYIPAPTFQFPAIPGVSEYQRSSDGYGKDKGTGDGMEHMIDGQRSLMPDFSTVCPFNTLRCNDGKRCILRSEWCDGQVDCNDASDEMSCSCRDRISKERLCDGYFDCPHGEDELGCLGCSKTSFSCNDWRSRYSTDNCVPLSQRCDGIKQCPNGKDEVDCNILTPSFTEGKNMFTIGYTEGYLHKNYKGQWYPVCTPVDSWTKDACSSEIGQEVNETLKIQMQFIPGNAYQGPYVAEVNGKIKLIPSCMNRATYVRCPAFPCGTRVSSTQDLLPQVLEHEDQSVLQPFNNIIDYRSGSNDKDQLEVEENDDADKILGSQLRVVGGRASHPNAWPFLVAIYKDGHFYCGGVILNELWILTAAHCLDGYSGHYFEIQAGLLRQFSFAPMAQSRKARYIVIHPQYNDRDMRNDVGMIKLDDPLRFNRWVRPVCLPDEDLLGVMWRRKPEVNTTCIATGWGAIKENGMDPDHLREVEVPILKTCKYEIDKTENVICAGYPEGGRDACQGDSGGPLMCKNPYKESQWYVAGIVSHGEGCGRPDEPGVYTRVSHFRDWIRETSSTQGLSPLGRSSLDKCPGFSCNGGLGRCLPIEARCNGVVDCLDAEDERLCRETLKYPPYRQRNDPGKDYQFVDYANAIPITSEETFISEGTTTSERATIFEETTTSERATNSEETTTSERANNSEEITTSERATTSETILTTDFQVTDTTTQSTSTEDQTTDPEPSTSTTEYLNHVNSELPSISGEVPIVFTCSKMLQTIPISKRCDRVVDCEDSTDELNCTCKDFLVNVKPSAICNGYVDCDDKSDEKDCEICSKDEFYCRVTKKCISADKKCDRKFDCQFLEDEQDCFTLSNGRSVYLDADERPSLLMQGILTQNVNGKWRPACHIPKMRQNQSTVMLIGRNMCTFFGFAHLESSEPVSVRDSELETINWNKKSSAFQESPSAASLSDDDKTCLGIKIRCRPVLNSGESTYLIPDAGTGSRGHQWPWIAAIFVDGSYRCSAILLDNSWLLSASKCTENVRLDTNYTTAVLGYGPLFRYVDGPHQQVSIIDELQHVNDSVSMLLHMKHPVNFTRYVQPLFVERTIYPPGSNDACKAIGTDENHETKSISLRPVLKNCQSCQRCFVNASVTECSGASEWSGTIFCRGKKGWYPAAAFEDENGPCDFRNTQALTSIDHINPYLTEALDNARLSTEASCDGFRCNLGQCIPESRVCDGIPDCRDQADEDPEYCGKIRENCDNNINGCNCLKSELRCGNGKCVDKSAFGDGIMDCEDRSDEPNICTCAEYLKLTNPERLCDGVRHCLDKTDELPEICPCTDTGFKCMTSSGNDACIPQDFICDGDADCINGEDESECRKLITSPNNSSSIDSGEIIHRSYGVWHTECFEDPITLHEEANNLCKSLGYSYGDVKTDIMPTGKPMVPDRDSFYMVKLNNFLWMTLRDDKPLVTLVEADENCHRAFVTCV